MQRVKALGAARVNKQEEEEEAAYSDGWSAGGQGVPARRCRRSAVCVTGGQGGKRKWGRRLFFPRPLAFNRRRGLTMAEERKKTSGAETICLLTSGQSSRRFAVVAAAESVNHVTATAEE